MTRTDCHLFVDPLEGARYLVNASGWGIERLVYSTWSYPFLDGGGGQVVSSRPFYEVANLPAGCRIWLEDVDPYEDGIILFRAEEVLWEDGLKEEKHLLGSQQATYNLMATRHLREQLKAVKEASARDIRLVEAERRRIAVEEGGVIPPGADFLPGEHGFPRISLEGGRLTGCFLL